MYIFVQMSDTIQNYWQLTFSPKSVSLPDQTKRWGTSRKWGGTQKDWILHIKTDFVLVQILCNLKIQKKTAGYRMFEMYLMQIFLILK